MELRGSLGTKGKKKKGKKRKKNFFTHPQELEIPTEGATKKKKKAHKGPFQLKLQQRKELHTERE